METRSKNDESPHKGVEIDCVPAEKTVPTFGRTVLVVAGALNFGCGLGLPISLSVMFLSWQESFSTTRAATAAVHSTCVGILFGGGVVAGYVINRFGARTSFIIGSCLASLGMFLGAFATNITFLLVSVGILAGCGCCLIQLPCIPCVTRPFRTRQGTIIAIVSSGGALVNLVTPYLYDFLMDTYSWRGAFIIISGLCFNTLVLELIMTSYMPSLQLTPPTDSSPEVVKLVSAEGIDLELVEVDVNGVTQGHDHLNRDHVLDSCSKTEDGSSSTLNGGNDRPKAAGFDTSQHVGLSIGLSNNAGETSGKGKDISTNKPNLEKASDECVDSKPTNGLVGTQLDPVNVDEDIVHSRLSLARLRQSPWRFLLDPLSWAILAFLGLSLASQFCTNMLAMDIAANKGFPEKGLLIIMVGIVAGLFGKALSGIFGLFRNLPSFLLLAASGVLGSVALFLLGSASRLSATMASMIGSNISMGLIVTLFPKCFLDLPSMDVESYPLALGLGNTVEGVFDFLIPILTGHMVDVSGTYMLPFSILSGVSLLTSCLLALVYWWTQRNSKRS